MADERGPADADGRDESSGTPREGPEPEPGEGPGPAKGPEGRSAEAGSGGADAPGRGGPQGDAPEGDASGRGGDGERAEEPGRGRGWSDAISEMQNLVGDVVGEVLEGVRDAAGRRFSRVDMIRGANGDYLVLMDLPGVDRDEVKVTTLGGELTISGERPRPELSEGTEVLRTERGYGSFRRTLRLPPDIDEAGVSARLEGGVLEIRLPRKSPSDARTVDIE